MANERLGRCAGVAPAGEAARAQGADPPTLSAAGYAEMDPLAPNTSAETRKRNRRTEITVMPNIDEAVSVP